MKQYLFPHNENDDMPLFFDKTRYNIPMTYALRIKNLILQICAFWRLKEMVENAAFLMVSK